MADKYMEYLEAQSKSTDDTPAGRKRRKDLEARINAYNAANDYWRQQKKPYLIPGEYNYGGWVKPYPPYDMYVTVPPIEKGNAELADTISHEGLHRRRDIAGSPSETRSAPFGGEVGRGALGHPDASALLRLQQILSEQKTYPTPENYNENPEETYATYAGIEGRLPRGVPITKAPEFAEIANSQRLKDLLFRETSVPYGGIWEGQVPVSITDALIEWMKKKFGF